MRGGLIKLIFHDIKWLLNSSPQKAHFYYPIGMGDWNERIHSSPVWVGICPWAVGVSSKVCVQKEESQDFCEQQMIKISQLPPGNLKVVWSKIAVILSVPCQIICIYAWADGSNVHPASSSGCLTLPMSIRYIFSRLRLSHYVHGQKEHKQGTQYHLDLLKSFTLLCADCRVSALPVSEYLCNQEITSKWPHWWNNTPSQCCTV